MAVEIPVIIDIQKTFRDAASLVSSAAKPLESAFDEVALEASNKLTKRLSNAVAKFNKNTQDPDRMDKYASSITNAARAIKKMAEEQGRLTMGKTDVRDLYTQIVALTNKWKTAKRSWKFDEDGKLRSQAMDLATQIQKAALKMQEFGRAEQYAAMAAEKHQQELSREIVSLDDLNVALAAWRKELSAASGNPLDEHFANAARMATQLEARLQGLTNNIKILGSNSGSIDQLQLRLSELNRQFSALSASDRKGAVGKGILEQYRQLSAEMEKEVKTAAQIVQEEKARAAAIEKITKTRKYENAVLNQSSKSMRILQEQERILSDRLQRTQVGTKKFQELARRLAEVRKELEHAEAVVRRGGEEFRNLGNSAGNAATKIGSANAALSKQSGIMRMLTGYVSGYTAIFAAFRFIHNIRETTAELELQKVALGSILQDGEKAVDMFRDIKAAALKSPFEIKDLVTYTKQLAAYRIEQDKLFDTTMKLADVSAGLGVDMNRLILAYGQVRAASVLRGQELRQFTEAGIPLVEELAKKFEKLGRAGTTTADVFELISRRAVPFSMIEEIFNDMTEAGGIFYKMQEKQSETLKGQWMKLKDAITIMYDEMGNTDVVHKYMTGFINDLLNLTRSWKEVGRWIGGVTQLLIAYKVVAKASALATTQLSKAEMLRVAATKANTIALPKSIAAIVGETAAKKINRAVTRQVAIAQLRLASANTVLGKSFWKLYAAIMANPYAAAAAAVVGLVSAIAILIKNNREVPITVDEMNQSISRFKDAAQDASDTSKLVASYERLSKKAEKTADEIDELRRVTNELARTYPAAVNGINRETGALEINIEKVKELSKAEYELEMARIRRDEKRTRRRVAEIEKERDQIIRNKERGGHETFMGGWVEWTDDELAEMGRRLKEIRDELEPLKRDLEELDDMMFIGPLPPPDMKTKEGLNGWKKVLSEIQKKATDAGATTFFTPQDIEQLKSIKDLWKQTKSGIEEAETALSSLQSIQDTLADDSARETNLAQINKVKEDLKFWQEVQKIFNFVFKKDSQSYQQDPFIKQMQERIKFMKDFQKGYEDLSKYMDENAALAKESSIMRTRGLALGLSEAEQKKAAKDLAEWYGTEMTRIYTDVQKKYGLSMTLDQFLSQEIKDASNRGRALRDWQSLLQSIFNDQTDLETSNAKKALEKAIKKLKDDLKRSEEAKNFFQDILGLTGDEDLATNLAVSVYGDPGKELGERIQKSLTDALNAPTGDKPSVTAAQRAAIERAAATLDFRDVLKHVDEYPDHVRDAVKEAASIVEKYNVETAKSYAKLLMTYNETAQQEVNIKNKAAKDEKAIAEGLALQEKAIREKYAKDPALMQAELKDAKDSAEAATNAVTRQKELELSRLKSDYMLFFNSVGILSKKSARDVAATQKKMLAAQLANQEISFAKYQRELKAIDEQLSKYSKDYSLTRILFTDGVDAAIAKLREYSDSMAAFQSKIPDMYKEGKIKVEVDETTGKLKAVFSDDAQAFLDRMDNVLNAGSLAKFFSGSNFTDRFNKALNESYEIAAGKSADNAKNIANSLTAAGEVFGEGSSEFAAAASATAETMSEIVLIYKTLLSWINWIDSDLEKRERSGEGFAEDWWSYFYGGVSGFDSALSKVMSGDFFGAMNDLYEGFSGLTGKVRLSNNEIERQSRILDDLQYQYDRLETALSKSFGSDYIANYNQEIENLRAQAEAYRKQAEAEQEKGKEADRNKIDEYNRAAQKVEDQIDDAQSKVSEFMTGTDLTSAAKEFAEAWIEAYKQFGNTTDAMSEKFNEMIENMVVNSLAAQLVQSILKPVFKQIDKAAEDGALTAQEIASISAMVPGAVEQINGALTGMVSDLSAAGLNLRQQAGQFTGISRDIAGASEESITGLAAGINTQNFYISHIDANVAAILSALTAGASTAGASVTGEYVDPYKDFVMKNIEMYFPSFDQKLGDILHALQRVIRPRTDRPEYVLHTNL